MENYRLRINEAVKSHNHRALLSLMNNSMYSSRILPTRLFLNVLMKNFHDVIISYSRAPILVKRNVSVHFTTLSNSNSNDFLVKLIDNNNSEVIAEVECRVMVMSKPRAPASCFSINISAGHTKNQYSKTGNRRPVNNGPGYGTIIRAFICAASKKLGALGVTQMSAFITNRNKAAALSGALKQPVSGYIMNKLGFSKNTNRNTSNRIAPHTRQLLFKNVSGDWSNVPTPALNSVMNDIFRNSV